MRFLRLLTNSIALSTLLLLLFVVSVAAQSQSCQVGETRQRTVNNHIVTEECSCFGFLWFRTCSWPNVTEKEPTVTPSPPQREATATPTPVPTAVFVNSGLPPAVLTISSLLYASPNRNEAIIPDTIPVHETIYVMGRNATGSHLRVVWNNAVGWVPVSFTNYNGQRRVFDAVPIFVREPPACAVPVTTQFGLSSTWTSTERQRIAVIVDLFRVKYGDFPHSSFSLVVNDKVVETSRRPIVEQGQFPLKDVVFTLPQDIQSGDVVGYALDTSSRESLSFVATIFRIPSGCQWKIN